MKRAGTLALAAVCAAALSLPQAAYSQSAPMDRAPGEAAKAPLPPGVPTNDLNVHLPTEGEMKLGRESVVQVERHYKIIKSGPYHERLQRIAGDVVLSISRQDIIGEYKRVYNLPRREDKAKRVPFEWSFKVVDTTKEVNAFSLAGGPIYVTKGLMDYAASDHELAAVLAHECAHVQFHHVEQMVKKQKSASGKQIWGLLAAVLIGAAGGGEAAVAASNILMAGQLVSIATMTGYGRELEHEADRVGVLALAGTDYNPVGMMTFMSKLARDDRLRGNPDFGIFQSHPYSNQRVAAIKAQVEKLGYKADTGAQRQVSAAFRVTTEPDRHDGKPAVQLKLNGTTMFTVVAPENGMSVQERAERIATQIERLFEDNLTYNDVRRSADKTAVTLKGITVIRVLPDDADVMGSAEAAAEKAYNQIVRALLKEQLDKPF